MLHRKKSFKHEAASARALRIDGRCLWGSFQRGRGAKDEAAEPNQPKGPSTPQSNGTPCAVRHSQKCTLTQPPVVSPSPCIVDAIKRTETTGSASEIPPPRGLSFAPPPQGQALSTAATRDPKKKHRRQNRRCGLARAACFILRKSIHHTEFFKLASRVILTSSAGQDTTDDRTENRRRKKKSCRRSHGACRVRRPRGAQYCLSAGLHQRRRLPKASWRPAAGPSREAGREGLAGPPAWVVRPEGEGAADQANARGFATAVARADSDKVAGVADRNSGRIRWPRTSSVASHGPTSLDRYFLGGGPLSGVALVALRLPWCACRHERYCNLLAISNCFRDFETTGRSSVHKTKAAWSRLESFGCNTGGNRSKRYSYATDFYQ